jgi:hypothetical protein
VEIGTDWRGQAEWLFFSLVMQDIGIEFVDGSDDFNIFILQIFPEFWGKSK